MKLSAIVVLSVLAKINRLVSGDCGSFYSDGWTFGIVLEDACYAMDVVDRVTDCDDGCKERISTFSFYNGGDCTGLPYELYGSLTFSSVFNCPDKEDFCSVETSEGACTACTIIDETSAMVDCNNLEMFQINDFEPVIFSRQGYDGWFQSSDEICAHPSNDFEIPGLADPGPCAESPNTESPGTGNDGGNPDGGTNNGGDNQGGDNQGGSCFSVVDTVNVLGKGVVSMSDLHIGDRVLVSSAATGGGDKFEPIYSFAHYELAKEHDFIQLYTSRNMERPLEVTKEHLVFVVSGDESGAPQAVRADQVRKGDTLLQVTPGQVAPALVSVVKIAKTTRKGRIAPLTPSGKIVVNSLQASAYISLEDYLPEALRASLWTIFSLDDDKLFHLFLSPYRMMCTGVSVAFCDISLENYSDDGIPAVLVAYELFAKFAVRQPYVLQVVFLWIPILVVFGFLNLLEQIFGYAMAPTVVVLIVSGFYAWKYAERDELKKKHKAA